MIVHLVAWNLDVLNKQLNKLNPDDKSPIKFVHLETGNKIEKFDKYKC